MWATLYNYHSPENKPRTNMTYWHHDHTCIPPGDQLHCQIPPKPSLVQIQLGQPFEILATYTRASTSYHFYCVSYLKPVTTYCFADTIQVIFGSQPEVWTQCFLCFLLLWCSPHTQEHESDVALLTCSPPLFSQNPSHNFIFFNFQPYLFFTKNNFSKWPKVSPLVK